METTSLSRAARYAGARIVLLSAPSKGNAPIVEVIGRRIGFEKAAMTTVHAYTSSQSLVDGPHKHFRRGRAAAANLVPTTTGAADATTRALPQYVGLFDGLAIRAPIVGSIADITFVTSRKTTVEEVNDILTEESETERYVSVLGVSPDRLVSSDIIGDPRALVVDLQLTKVIDGDLVKIMSWYDNEWGYANQMVREAAAISRGINAASPHDLVRG
jgi:glyceraldehyde 3-phosphate dehydrogenase